MENLTKEEIENDLKSYRTIIDDDNIRIKDKIKKALQSNPYIKYVLRNMGDTDEAEDIDNDDDDIFDTNIIPYFAIFDTQTEVDNFICFETSTDEIKKYSGGTTKFMQIIFKVYCHSRSVKNEKLGMALHDVLSALLKDQFDYTDIFGMKIHCVSDVPTLVDNRYVCRTIIFQSTTDNNVAKTVNGTPRLINKQRGLSIDDDSIRIKTK